MNKVLIVSDSTCDLSSELLAQYDIKTIPLHVNFTNESYLDTVEINSIQLIEKVKEKNEIPKTAAVSPNEFITFLKPYIDEGYDIFYTGLGSSLSTTYQSFMIAKEEFPEGRLYASDSCNLSTGIGLLLLKACKYRDLGYSAKDIKTEIDKIVPRVRVQFVLKTLDYLYKGGRCSAMKQIIGTVLRLRPMIVVRDSKLKVGKTNIGLMKNAVGNMANLFIKDLNNIDTEFVFITDSYNSEQSISVIDNEFNKNNVFNIVEHVYRTKAGSVITSHCGPGCIGILYILKGNIKEDTVE